MPGTFPIFFYRMEEEIMPVMRLGTSWSKLEFSWDQKVVYQHWPRTRRLLNHTLTHYKREREREREGMERNEKQAAECA